jgi:hypothetical protein
MVLNMNQYRIQLPLIRAEIVNPTGERFYNGFSYAFDLYDQHASFKDVIAWCEERFGADDPEGHWMTETNTMATVVVWFRESAEAMEFKLRWA